jgi:hypothetical protein
MTRLLIFTQENPSPHQDISGSVCSRDADTISTGMTLKEAQKPTSQAALLPSPSPDLLSTFHKPS